MVNKRKEKPQIITYIIVALLAFVFLYPFWHTAVMSFSDTAFANEPGFKFWPKIVSLDAYKKVLSDNSIYIGYANTIIRTVFGTIITLAITFCAAFTMSHKNLKGKALLNFLIVFTMFFNGGLIPTYMNLKALGLLNTRWVLILPAAAGAWNFIIMRNFVSAIGPEMEEAARIDGASVYQTMLKIILPLSKPVMAVIGLWSVVNHWNAWYDSLTYANKNDLIVLQTVIRRLIDRSDAEAAAGEVVEMVSSSPQTVRAATVMIATLPILLGYPFIQKYLVKGTMVGAVKG